MITDEAISVACEQKLWWISQGVTPRMAYRWLTGRRVLDVDWAQVEGWIIRWWCAQELPRDGPIQLAA